LQVVVEVTQAVAVLAVLSIHHLNLLLVLTL
jgi:hypothetical protein